MKKWNLKSKLFAIIGAISIALSVFIFAQTVNKNLRTNDLWGHEYGGDAYTGIQNAAASTGRNVAYVADYICYGFSSVLLVAGLVLFVVAIPSKEENAEEE